MLVNEFVTYVSNLELWKAVIWIALIWFWVLLICEFFARCLGVFLAAVHYAIFLVLMIFSEKMREEYRRFK